MTEKTSLYPLLLEPALHTKVWGGRKLADHLGKTLPTDEPYGESWELHDTSTVRNGPLAGATVGGLIERYGRDLIGDNDPSEGLPLLAKLIDADQWLSVQVHPNDAQAAVLEGQPRGKTEAWYVLAADPDAQLIIGVTPGTDRDAMAAAIHDKALEAMLVYQPVQAGDVLFIPAGTVHALGPGVMIYEIQQSSNTTYRLYDWNRVGLDGKPRELHIEKGVQVSNVESLPAVSHVGNGSIVPVVSSPYFTTVLHRLAGQTESLKSAGYFHALTCIQGTAVVSAGDDRVEMPLGATIMIPASLGDYTLSGTGEVLRSWQGDAG